MKNIHILPTDKSSRLIKQGKDLDELWLYTRPIDYRENELYPQHIYITSNEEIKDGDWCLDKFNQRWKLEDKKLIGFDNKGIKRFSTDNILGHECKKIILTTDPDLIKDGIQSIDDEFLEWFVKNPSCERVEVNYDVFEKTGNISVWEYEIIIPQEEVLVSKDVNCLTCGLSFNTTYNNNTGDYSDVYCSEDCYKTQEKPKQQNI
jgi:hypothetical protein